ncbi:MAG: outer membrane lipoprotein-sorting protein [Gammaproteobacteria bacterium]|nr:outer membrane lipoprotein-sorting protein [Gammaproteobacteria bacterium]
MRMTGALMLLALGMAAWGPAGADEASSPDGVNAREVVQQCNFKYPGDDQQTRLSIILRDKDGNEKKNVYRRYWKDYKGKEGIADKMVLITEFPPDAKGSVFMRWGYTSTNKNADQWIYLPVLKKTRRVSVRDPGESFLGSDLTHGDISGRALDDDEHRLVKTEQRGEETLYVVESVPRDPANALYSKVLSMFAKPGQDWSDCAKRQVEYFDRRGEPLKQQVISWQRSGDAWLWDEMTVRNTQTEHTSIFQVTDVQTNVGLKDDVFTERNLTKGH